MVNAECVVKPRLPKSSECLLCAGEAVANATGLKRVKVRFIPTRPNQYPAKTIHWDLRVTGVNRLSLTLTT